MALFFEADTGVTREVKPKNGPQFSLEELQALVGGYIEIVHPPRHPGKLLVINEEGKLQGLPLNRVACALWYSEDPIVGNALLCNAEEVD